MTSPHEKVFAKDRSGRLPLWAAEHIASRRPLAVLGDIAELELPKRGVFRPVRFPPLRWGNPRPAALAEVLLQAMGAPRASDWHRILAATAD